MNCAVTRVYSGLSDRASAAMLIVLMLLAACSGPATDAEAELRQWVADGQAAAEAKQRRALMNMISSAYADARGNDRERIDEVLRVYFFRQNNIKLLVSIEAIRVMGETAAEIDLTVGMAGTNDGVLGFSADAYRFQMELEKNAGDWLLIAARWGELGEELR